MTWKTTGYGFTLLAIFIFAVQDGISKHLGGIYPPVFVAMIRYWAFAAFAILLAVRSRAGLKAAIQTKQPWLQILRGVLLVSQIVLVITSFKLVGLAHSQTILSSTPLFVAMLSMPLLGERVGWRRWTAICVGLAGVLLIVSPSSGGFEIGVLLPLFGALMFAVYVIATRLASRTDTAITSFLYIGVVGALAVSLIGPFFWTALAPVDWIWMLLLCVTGMSSHYFLIRAYDLLDASAVQPLTYLQIVLALAVGALVFDETISLNMIAGSIIVVGAGIFTIWRESVVSRRREAVSETTDP
ncbi:DMT family transporter [Pararhizobium sp.]|uniref:DMT family transporter n=1 Tax=Pararhizobium sp. TaxID=1977563 RepID=UPI00272859AB|nr:DMT family transporter [Pararhizobium sp.]MDO9416173.1 DMT family transporter [Pararhizobium sp.]